MPLITSAYLALAAGLLMGFGGEFVLGLVLALATGAAALARGRTRAVGLALVAAAGVSIAHAERSQERRCVLQLATLREWRAVIADSVAPGAYAPAELRGVGCAAAGALAVIAGRAAAGSSVLVRGEPAPASRGLVVHHAVLVPSGERAILVALRGRAARVIDRVFGRDAPLARALLIADMRAIPAEMRDRYAAAGIVHLLSISGLHVAIVAAAMQLIFQVAGLPRRAAVLASVAATALYVAVIGAPPPAVRSGAMLAAGAASRLAQRPTSPWASLALGATAPLAVDPRAVLDLGYQLSVSGIAALIASASLARRVLVPRLEGWRLRFARELLTSVVATVVTAPLVAWTFGRISLVAPLTNLVATPVLGLAQPILFLALLAAPAAPLARFAADAVHPLLSLFDRIATAGAALPISSAAVSPTLAAAAACAAASAAAVVACVSHFPARPALVALGASAFAAWMPSTFFVRRAGVELHMIDVGQGDALALRTPAGRWLLFDAGRSWNGGDAGRAAVIPYLRRRGGEVRAFVLSHPHADHVGGAASALAALRPAEYWDAAFAAGSDVYRASLETADRLGVHWRRVHPRDSLVVDSVVVRFLAPDSAWTVSLADPNEASTIALVRYGAVRFLLVGDAERGEERWLLEHEGSELRADVLKVGHHGSATSSTAPFLDAVRPRVALVSVGLGNSYGHPSADVVRDLKARGAMVLRTDRLGSVVVRSDGRTITVEANDSSWTLSADSPPR